MFFLVLLYLFIVVKGGKLLNIVTEDEQTSKLMLKKNSFSFNVRFIPNNKIVGRAMDD